MLNAIDQDIADAILDALERTHGLTAQSAAGLSAITGIDVDHVERVADALAAVGRLPAVNGNPVASPVQSAPETLGKLTG
jgi:hypothetical protein